MSVHDDDIRHVLGQMRQAEVDALEPTDFEALRAEVEARMSEGDALSEDAFAQFDRAPEVAGPQESNTESSSLFSLETLSIASAQDTGASTTENSGLLDIQHLASIHQLAQTPEEPQHIPQTMALAPVMPARGSHRSNLPLVLGAGAAALLLGVVGVLGYMVVSKPDPVQPQKVIVEKTIIEKAVPVPAAASASEADKAAEKAKETAAKAAETENENPESGQDTSSKKTSKSKRSSSRRSTSKPKDSSPAAPSRPTSRKKKKDGIDNLLSNLDSKQPKKKAAPKVAPPPTTKSNAKLSKSQVKGTFSKYNGRFTTCARSSNRSGLKGTVWVSMKIEASGRVSKASIAAKSSKFKSTDIGRCVTKVVRSMKFPAASDPTSFTYPMPIR